MLVLVLGVFSRILFFRCFAFSVLCLRIGFEARAHPIFFTKAPTTINDPYDDIVYPRVTERLGYEVELALVIGKEGKYTAEEDAYDHIAGYSAFNTYPHGTSRRGIASGTKGRA